LVQIWARYPPKSRGKFLNPTLNSKRGNQADGLWVWIMVLRTINPMTITRERDREGERGREREREGYRGRVREEVSLFWFLMSEVPHLCLGSYCGPGGDQPEDHQPNPRTISHSIYLSLSLSLYLALSLSLSLSQTSTPHSKLQTKPKLQPRKPG